MAKKKQPVKEKDWLAAREEEEKTWKQRRVLCYIRSNNELALKSVKRQHEELVIYCARSGYQVVETYYDVCLGTTTLDSRPSWNKLYKKLLKGSANAVVCCGTTRFSLDYVDGMKWLDVLKDIKVSLICKVLDTFLDSRTNPFVQLELPFLGYWVNHGLKEPCDEEAVSDEEAVAEEAVADSEDEECEEPLVVARRSLRVLAYARTSTIRQVYGLEEQIRKLKSHCADKGWDLVGIYQEQCSAAGYPVDREQLRELLLRLFNDHADAILCTEFDRFTRDAKGRRTIDEIKEHGKQFLLVNV